VVMAGLAGAGRVVHPCATGRAANGPAGLQLAALRAPSLNVVQVNQMSLRQRMYRMIE
jgi:hypothetical protein